MRKIRQGDNVRFFDWDSSEYRDAEVLDRNGSLVYVETEDGETHWRDVQELGLPEGNRLRRVR